MRSRSQSGRRRVLPQIGMAQTSATTCTSTDEQGRRVKMPQIMQPGVREQFASATTVSFEVRR